MHIFANPATYALQGVFLDLIWVFGEICLFVLGTIRIIPEVRGHGGNGFVHTSSPLASIMGSPTVQVDDKYVASTHL